MSPEVLTGPWRRVGLIQRWSPTPTPAELAALRAILRTRPTPPRRPDPTLIACPTCLATITQTCRSSGGNPREPHTGRLVSRRCPCGALLGWKRQLCDTCRERARKQTYRLREIRKPSRERRRAA